MSRMEEFLKSSLLETLCDSRMDEFETLCIREFNERLADGIDYEQQLIDLFNNNVKDKSKYSSFRDALNKLEQCIFFDMSTSIRRAYKLGFMDGNNMKKEIADLKEEVKNE